MVPEGGDSAHFWCRAWLHFSFYFFLFCSHEQSLSTPFLILFIPFLFPWAITLTTAWRTWLWAIPGPSPLEPSSFSQLVCSRVSARLPHPGALFQVSLLVPQHSPVCPHRMLVWHRKRFIWELETITSSKRSSLASYSSFHSTTIIETSISCPYNNFLQAESILFFLSLLSPTRIQAFGSSFSFSWEKRIFSFSQLYPQCLEYNCSPRYLLNVLWTEAEGQELVFKR